MATNKKYYYLKLKENFYESEQLIILQNMQDGYLYSDILMKLYLRSLKTEGKLMFNDLIPYTPSVLAQIVRHQVGTVEKALKIFKELGLIEILDNGAIYMMDIQNFIGKSSSEGDRKREYRNKIQNEKNNLLGQMSDKRPPEIDIEIEKDIEIKKEKDSIFDFVEKNFGRTLNPIENEQISEWEDNELTRHAIKQAILNGAYSFRYINKILHNYKMNNIQTVQQAQEADKKFRERKEEQNKYKGLSFREQERLREEQAIKEWLEEE